MKPNYVARGLIQGFEEFHKRMAPFEEACRKARESGDLAAQEEANARFWEEGSKLQREVKK